MKATNIGRILPRPHRILKKALVLLDVIPFVVCLAAKILVRSLLLWPLLCLVCALFSLWIAPEETRTVVADFLLHGSSTTQIQVFLDKTLGLAFLMAILEKLISIAFHEGGQP